MRLAPNQSASKSYWFLSAMPSGSFCQPYCHRLSVFTTSYLNNWIASLLQSLLLPLLKTLWVNLDTSFLLTLLLKTTSKSHQFCCLAIPEDCPHTFICHWHPLTLLSQMGPWEEPQDWSLCPLSSLYNPLSLLHYLRKLLKLKIWACCLPHFSLGWKWGPNPLTWPRRCYGM